MLPRVLQSDGWARCLCFFAFAEVVSKFEFRDSIYLNHSSNVMSHKCDVYADKVSVIILDHYEWKKILTCNVCNEIVKGSYVRGLIQISRPQTSDDKCGCYSQEPIPDFDPPEPLKVKKCGDCAKEYLQKPKLMETSLYIIVCDKCYNDSLMLKNM